MIEIKMLVHLILFSLFYVQDIMGLVNYWHHELAAPMPPKPPPKIKLWNLILFIYHYSLNSYFKMTTPPPVSLFSEKPRLNFFFFFQSYLSPSVVLDFFFIYLSFFFFLNLFFPSLPHAVLVLFLFFISFFFLFLSFSFSFSFLSFFFFFLYFLQL